MKRKLLMSLCFCFVISAPSTKSQMGEDSAAMQPVPTSAAIAPPAAVFNVDLKDTPNDNGHSITIKWDLSADDGAGQNNVLGYRIFRSQSRDGEFAERGMVPLGSGQYIDFGGSKEEDADFMPNGIDYFYRVRTITADSTVFTDSPVFGPVQTSGQWYNQARTLVLIFCLIFAALTAYFIAKARRGAELFVRKLAGIEAIDEAIGRATEMGKPILYVLGLGTAADIATIASFTILGRVAKKVAEYQTGLIVPCNDPIVMTVAQETVKSSYLDAGRPELYNDDIVFFVTSLQFPYVAAVNGIMLRQLPATNIYMGKFYAESLLLAETGALAGSIQISGTDEIAQIPFFVVACDYTLIGEELYAASAYLGREPILLGSLKAQDYAKAAVIFLAFVGMLAAHFEWNAFVELFHLTN